MFRSNYSEDISKQFFFSEISPIDGLDLETTVSCNVFNAYDYICRPANYRKAVIATNKLNECKNNSTSGDASEKGPSKEEEDDSKYGAAKCAFSGDSAKLSSGIVRWTRIFYLNEDKPSQPLVDEANDTDRLPQKLARVRSHICVATSESFDITKYLPIASLRIGSCISRPVY